MTPALVLALVVPGSFLAAAWLGVALGSRRPVVGWVAVTGAAHASAVLLSSLAQRGEHDTLHVLSQCLFGLGFAALVALAACYPDGRAWSVPARIAVAVGVLAPVVGGLAGPSPVVFETGEAGELGPVAEVLPTALAPVGAVVLGLPLAAATIFALRYARADRGRRRELRWPLLGVAVVAAFVVVGLLLRSSLTAVADALFVMAAPALPLSLVVGAAPARLVDADAAVRRAAVFGGPWLVMAAAYGVGASASAWAASSRSLVTALLVGALASVMLAEPVRRRLVDLADDRARLTGELAAQVVAVEESRARIAAAADQERRRLERDLHDGLQQELLALLAGIEVARAAGTDEEREHALSGARELGQHAYRSVRDLAHAVRPAILDDLGLVAAVEACAARSGVPVRVVTADLPPLPAEVEDAAYFLAREGLVNVTKHAPAARAELRLDLVDGMLRLEVRDDGGAAVDEEGSGVRGLADRCAALGGRLELGVESGWTVLRGLLPVTPGADR
jgi:signal transduction histidine kinase